MKPVFLAGVSASGKTTVAKMLKKYGLEPYYVYTDSCDTIPPAKRPGVRQLCFVNTIANTSIHVANCEYCRRYVVDNSAFSAMAYSKVFEERYTRQRDVVFYARMIAANIASLEMKRGIVVALVVDEDELKQRLKAKGSRLPPIVHLEAQRRLISDAEFYDLPIVKTSGKKPEEVAEEVATLVL